MKDKCDQIWDELKDIREFSPTYYLSFLWFKKFGREIKGDVLDVGSGDCRRPALFFDMSKINYTGIDHSDVAVKYANEKGVKCYKMSATDFDINEKFDYVLSIDNIEHLKDDKKCLLNIFSHLKKNGKLILFTSINQKYWGVLDEEAGHCRRYDPDKLIKMIKECGFTIERVHYKGFLMAKMYRKLVHALGKGKGEKKKDTRYVPKGKLLKAYLFIAPLILPIFRIDMLFDSPVFRNFSRGIMLVARK